MEYQKTRMINKYLKKDIYLQKKYIKLIIDIVNEQLMIDNLRPIIIV